VPTEEKTDSREMPFLPTALPSLTATATLHTTVIGTQTPTPPNNFISTLAVVDCSPTTLWDLSQFIVTPLFADNFDTGALPIWELPNGWQTTPSETGQTLTLSNTDSPAQVVTMDALHNLSVTFKVRLDSGNASILLRQSATSAYRVTFYATGEIALWRGDMLICGRAAFTPTVGAWHEVAIMLFDNALTLMIDGMPLLSYTDSDPLPAGGFALQGAVNGVVSFDDVEVARLALGVPLETATPVETEWVSATSGEVCPFGWNHTLSFSTWNSNGWTLTNLFSLQRGIEGNNGTMRSTYSLPIGVTFTRIDAHVTGFPHDPLAAPAIGYKSLSVAGTVLTCQNNYGTITGTGDRCLPPLSSGYYPLDWTGSVSGNVEIIISFGSDSTWGILPYIDFIGTGANPFPPYDCNLPPTFTPTPTSTFTPSSTPTPTPLAWSSTGSVQIQPDAPVPTVLTFRPEECNGVNSREDHRDCAVLVLQDYVAANGPLTWKNVVALVMYFEGNIVLGSSPSTDGTFIFPGQVSKCFDNRGSAATPVWHPATEEPSLSSVAQNCIELQRKFAKAVVELLHNVCTGAGVRLPYGTDQCDEVGFLDYISGSQGFYQWVISREYATESVSENSPFYGMSLGQYVAAIGTRYEALATSVLNKFTIGDYQYGICPCSWVNDNAPRSGQNASLASYAYMTYITDYGKYFKVY